MHKLQVTVEHIGDYYWFEIRDEDRILARIGSDHELSQEEIEALKEEVLKQWERDDGWQP